MRRQSRAGSQVQDTKIQRKWCSGRRGVEVAKAVLCGTKDVGGVWWRSPRGGRQTAGDVEWRGSVG